MSFLKFIKHIFVFLLTFLLGTQITYAKTDLVLLQNQTFFSIEQTQSFQSLEKQLQPNIGFLIEKTRFEVSEGFSAQDQHEFSGIDVYLLGNAGESFASQIDNTVARLTGSAKFSLTGTGKYKIVKGHHPMAKKAFEGDLVYDYKEAFSVKVTSLENAWKTANQGIPQNIHSKITGQQNSLYSAWKKANPSEKMSIDEMANIEIQAMVNSGIPKDVATGWVVKSLDDLKLQGVTEIKNIPWNGTN